MACGFSTGGFDVKTFDFPADHQTYQPVMGGFSVRQFAGILPVTQNDDSVGAFINFAKPVGNIDDAYTLFAQFANQLQQALRLGERQTRSRFIHDDQPRVQ